MPLGIMAVPLELVVEAGWLPTGAPQHFLNFFPLLHGHGSLRPILGWVAEIRIHLFMLVSPHKRPGVGQRHIRWSRTK
jgi:hypothetical protein